MGEAFRERGYVFFINSNDHPPPHFHVRSDDAEAKFYLKPEVRLWENWGLAGHEITDIEKVAIENYTRLVTEWKRIHGRF